MNIGRDGLPSAAAQEGSDRSLLRRFRAGNEDAATALYVRYAQRLLRLAKYQTANSMLVRFDPDDVVQSVFRTFFRRAAEGFYEVPAGEELWQLLLVIALNKIRRLAEHHRAAKRDVAMTFAIEKTEPLAPGSGPETHQSLQILEMVIQEMLGNMPENQRRVISLRIDGHTVSEIADQVDVSKRSVERILKRFRGDLSTILDESDTM